MPSVENTVRQRVQLVRAEIAAACQRAGRTPDEVTLVAVSKQHSAADVVAAIAAGVRHLGENRVEEAVGKIKQVAELNTTPVQWHMVGHVQERKARHVVAGFAMLHSLDSLKLARRLNQYLSVRGDTLNVLLEVNVSGEETKAGWGALQWKHNTAQRRALWDDVAAITMLPGLRIRGLMTMAPIVADPEETRPVFARLRELRDALAADFAEPSWYDLSMGMTDDYPVAIEEGATLIRVGRAIFGPRR